MSRRSLLGVAWIAALAVGACGDPDHPEIPPPDAPVPPDGPGGPGGHACPGDNGGITLPDGFCATVFADGLGRARHLAVTPSGDVFVAIAPPAGTSEPGRVVALRDADRDGVAETVQEVLDLGGNGIAWQDGWLYVAPNDRIVRFVLGDGALVPERPEVLVAGLPIGGDHEFKTVLPVGDALYVNRGSATNSCQVENRALGSPGLDPCPELCERAGVWRYKVGKLGQPADRPPFATGVRNANALAVDRDGTLWAVVNGRDELHENWPERFTPEEGLRLPSEQIVALREGDDRGWPYCYHDPLRDDMMLAPEYGGDGATIGRCAAIPNPEGWLPAHAAPLGAVFYEGRQFPARYQGGLFVANHGSRFHEGDAGEVPGYNVVFIPFEGGAPGAWQEFAAGFAAGMRPLPEAAPHRPVDVEVMPDGALLISDDVGGRIWKVTYAYEKYE